MRRRRKNYKFTEKTPSIKGLVTFVVAAVLVLLYLVFVYLSFYQAGKLSVYYGSVGVLAMIFSVVTFIVSVTSLFEEDTFKLFPRLAIGTSILAVLLWGGTYVMGFVL